MVKWFIMIRFLLFDVDETLYPHSSSLWPLLRERIMQYMVERVGLTRPAAEALREQYLKQYGTTTRGLHLHNGIDIDEYLEYVHDVPINTVLFNDPELNSVLAQIPIEQCLFTNATHQHALNVTVALGISHHFTRIFGLEDFDFVSKPDPRPYEIVLKSLGAQGDECILIEDSLRNLETGKQMGMTTVLVDGQVPVPPEIVDFTISRVHDILDVIKRVRSEQ